MTAKKTKTSSKTSKRAAAHRRGAEARAKEAANPRVQTAPDTTDLNLETDQPDAMPRNAKKTNATVEPGKSKDTQGKGAYALESSNPDKPPSRKSTRGSANHQKPDSQLQRRATRRTRSPQARSQSRSG